ncbi:MAG: hypothetical protein HYZ73_03400 [Elusimicrobia bacterium]|nr:hypothetical protein [Elusimicrobiota bacterium]
MGEALLESQIIHLVFLTQTLVFEAWQRLKRYRDQRFSFTDVTSFTLMDQVGIERAFTFDSDFRRVGLTVFP